MKYPSLAILIPIYKEPTNLLIQNKNIFSKIKYNGKLNVYWVLHKSDTETIKEAKKLYDKIIIADTRLSLKGFILNYAIKRLSETYVGNFDIDNKVDSDYINTGIKTLVDNPNYSLSMGCAKISNLDDNILTRSQEIERLEWNEITKNMIIKETNGHAPIIGTGYFMKVKDFLEVGGYGENTVTEDADLTVRLIKHNKKSIFFDKVHYLEAPKTISNLIGQRIRWYKGTIQLMKNYPNLKKLNYTIHQSYMWTLFNPFFTLLILLKYFLLLFTHNTFVSITLLAIFLFNDFEIMNWELRKKHGWLKRRFTYSACVLSLLYLIIPILAYIRYKRNPMAWYEIKKGVK